MKVTTRRTPPALGEPLDLLRVIWAAVALTAKGRLVDVETEATVEAMAVTVFVRLGHGTLRTVKDGMAAMTELLDRGGGPFEGADGAVMTRAGAEPSARARPS